MPRIYLAPHLLEEGEREETFALDADSAKKLTRVLRLSEGETFIAFDGRGNEWECALASLGSEEKPREVRAALLEKRPEKATPKLHISVAQAAPKADKMELVLQKGTELGVAEFWPFAAERSVAIYEEDDRLSTRMSRWRKILEAAAMQSGRADVPILHAPCDLATVIDYGTANGSRCFFLDEQPDIETLKQAVTREPLEMEDNLSTRIMLIVGPEGGWSQSERDWAARYGAEPVSLGRLILRTETAALAACAALQWHAGELS